MLFSTGNHHHQAISLPFNWNADYANGKNVTEFDLSTHKRNDFYMIDKSQVVRFGLFGQGMKLFFEMSDGSFNLRGRRIEIEYHTKDGRVFGLTSNFAKKDIITFKKAYADYNNKDGIQRSDIESINFGYKTLYNKDDVSLFFQPIVSLPFNSSAFIELKMTSNIDVDGYLVFKNRGIEVERFEAPLMENRAMQINWTIK